MTRTQLIESVDDALEEYLEATEAWEDPRLMVDTSMEAAGIVEEEEAESLPATAETWFVMDFIRMDSEGRWEIDEEAVADLASELATE